MYIPSPIEDIVNISDDESSNASGAASASHIAAVGMSVPSSSYSNIRRRMLNFSVEYRDRNIPVVIADNETIGVIKDILEGEIGIPAGQQVLKGIKRKFDDTTILRDLHLPKDNSLYVLTPNINNPTLSRSREDNNHIHNHDMNEEYKLEISFNESSRYRMYNLKYPGRKTVQEVKQDLSNVSDIPVRHQIWTGWPQGTKDNLYLSQCGLDLPTHKLTLARANNTTNNKSTHRHTADEVVMELSSDEDEVIDSFQEDELFNSESDSTPSRRNTTLMPESFSDETEALEHLTREFKERYGETHPVFFIGSLDDAIKESLQLKATDRKLLAIYLHHDGSIFSNVFCSQLLCSDSIVNYLSSNFITWAWDLTHEANTNRFITTATRHFGSVAATQMRNYRSEDLPALLIISRSRATNEIVDVIQGHVTLDELMTRLIHSVEIFKEQQIADIAEELILSICIVRKLYVRYSKYSTYCFHLSVMQVRHADMELCLEIWMVYKTGLVCCTMYPFKDPSTQKMKQAINNDLAHIYLCKHPNFFFQIQQERTNRELIKQQQDAAYEESLAADKAKAEIQREEEAKRQAILEVELEKQREEDRLKQEEDDQQSVSRSLAPEPPEDATYLISQIRFRVQGGDVITRRFRADDTIQTLLNFLITKGFHTEEYKVITTYPRRDITQLDETQTLQDAKLFPQETLILEEKS
ncbi:hypothetical protein LOTGIDRAFT_120993 [Lottia gigantea]|uniref:UBX domain-containing protein n=1 Tax=Lottia gigantea TaxID=225164 RepID=V3ZM05_LOTGI|nr:hypothetical protein LOTGIDRAFT_120993 [Lottia gigantea]ESO92378.1 hypothetical protein LOTGIDRAFT_120993 [Lottia gigantea]